jgi:putative solute:sodium symporter small subunit
LEVDRNAPDSQPIEEGNMAEMTPAQREAYWGRTSRLMWIILTLWVIFSFVIPAFAVQLNSIKFLGFPLGFYMAAQGSLIAYVVLCFWNARAQNKIDEEFGVAED